MEIVLDVPTTYPITTGRITEMIHRNQESTAVQARQCFFPQENRHIVLRTEMHNAEINEEISKETNEENHNILRQSTEDK